MTIIIEDFESTTLDELPDSTPSSQSVTEVTTTNIVELSSDATYESTEKDEDYKSSTTVTFREHDKFSTTSISISNDNFEDTSEVINDDDDKVINISSPSNCPEPTGVNVKFYYLTIGLGALSGVLIVVIIILCFKRQVK